MIVRPYTSGTMQVSWRYSLQSMYAELVLGIIQDKWKPQHVPPDYSVPRQERDEILSRVHWLHPRPPTDSERGHSATGVGFYIPRNLRLIHDCDMVLSCIYPGYSSIDSAHEIGVAYARSKPIVTVDLTHGDRDYSAWRAMSVTVLNSLEEAAQFLLYQVIETDTRQDTDELNRQLNQNVESDKLPV